MVTRKTAIAVDYLRKIKENPHHPQEGMYVRLGYQYGVPVGQIIALTGLPSEVVIAQIEGGA